MFAFNKPEQEKTSLTKNTLILDYLMRMEKDLDIIKKELYYKDTRNAMIRDLIIRGLDSLKSESDFAHKEDSSLCSS